MRAQFAALGVKTLPESPAEAGEADGNCRVWAVNWESMLAFKRCETQWRTLLGPQGLIYLGLDYGAVLSLLGFYGHGREIFEDIKVMEDEALGPLNEARG